MSQDPLDRRAQNPQPPQIKDQMEQIKMWQNAGEEAPQLTMSDLGRLKERRNIDFHPPRERHPYRH